MHGSPFAELQVPVNTELLPANVRDKWVRPLYFGLNKPEARQLVKHHIREVDDGLISQLLAAFDWRPRTAAAFLAAITSRTCFTEQIGRLLLRSDICYAGAAYCVALAEFNTPEAVEFLDRYLAYYLKQTDLWFDQRSAMAALAYLDRLNQTARLAHHMDEWNHFIQNKSGWNLSDAIVHFEESMNVMHELQNDGG